ncbi:MAG: Lrp/AsnC ligand binding domain-containing protein [Candidatus Micrarchaeota archaeon]
MRIFIAVKAGDHADAEGLARTLRGMEGIEEAYELSGSLDIMLKARSDSAAGLKGIVESVKAFPGVASANSYLIIEERR